MNLFKKKVKPMLEEADVQYELIVTGSCPPALLTASLTV
jgi:hypothetical protein